MMTWGITAISLYIIYYLFTTIQKEDGIMANFLAYRILDGKLEFKRVPKRWKEEVRQILLDMDAGDLIVE